MNKRQALAFMRRVYGSMAAVRNNKAPMRYGKKLKFEDSLPEVPLKGPPRQYRVGLITFRREPGWMVIRGHGDSWAEAVSDFKRRIRGRVMNKRQALAVMRKVYGAAAMVRRETAPDEGMKQYQVGRGAPLSAEWFVPLGHGTTWAEAVEDFKANRALDYQAQVEAAYQAKRRRQLAAALRRMARAGVGKRKA